MSGDYVSTNDPVTVPFSDDQSEEVRDDELLFDESKPISAEERVSRQAKKDERTKRLLREGKENKAEVERLRAEATHNAARLARLEGYVSAIPTAQNQPAGDPYEAALDNVYRKQSEAYNAAQAEIKAGTFNDERGKHYERIAREVETEKTRIHTRRALDESRAGTRQEQAQQVWVQKYPDVYKNPNAYKYAQSTFERRKALGEQESNEMVDEVMSETMATFKLGPKKAPGATERSRLSGHSSSGGSGGGGNAGPNGGVQMTKELRKMATSLYSDLPEDEAVKKWANGPGRRLREAKVL